jgi:hypothetical protein
MQNVAVTINSVKQWLRPNGKITQADSEDPLGHWSSKSEPAAGADEINAWVLNYSGGETKNLKAAYSFNDNNQLVVLLSNEDGSALDGHESTAMAGQIIVDDMFDLTYALIDDDGDALGHNVFVYGALKFLDNTNDLQVALNGGGTATITAKPLFEDTLEAELHQDSALDRSDAIVFRTYTVNPTKDGGKITRRAIVKFVGQWEFDGADESLSFVTKVTGDLNKPRVKVAFGGKFKAVSAGFVYVNSGNEQLHIFRVRGEHKWDSGNAQWGVTLGYSNNTYKAIVDGDLSVELPEGTTFKLRGAFSIVKEEGHSPKFELEMNARYEIKGRGYIEFSADVSNTDGDLNYKLGFEGVYRLSKERTLTFGLLFGKQEAKGEALSISATLSNTFNLDVLITDIFGDTSQVIVTLSVEMRWKINPDTGKLELLPSEVMQS